MARRANRQNDKKNKTNLVRKRNRAASYVRLSREDKGNSIVHQKAFIREFAKEHGEIQIVSEFEDYNQTGTNFCRTGFLAMIKAIERQEVDCIIVKDLSRFGRNMYEVSRYLEQIFPLLGVRLISILDGYDSENLTSSGEALFLQIKCLLYERYVWDISRKIHTTLEIKQSRGEIVGSVPYGYQRQNGKIVVTEAAEVVQLIYQLALLGNRNGAIALKLDRMGYATPREYQKNGILKKESGKKESRWQTSSVGRILKNRAYTGVYCYHKSIQCLYKGERQKKVEREEWICVEDSYPIIIMDRIFERVQEIRFENGINLKR